jgi:YHS domain-containing protein
MNPLTNPDPNTVRPGDRITTACGSRTLYTPGTESALYNGQPVYFCLPVCKQDFERNPRSSCLALTMGHYEDGTAEQ